MSNEKYDTAVVGLALAALDGAQMMIDHLRKDRECVTAELAAARLEIASLQAQAQQCGAGAGCCAQAARIEALQAQLEAVGAPAQPVAPSPAAQDALAYQAACSLATRLFKKHFSKNVEYASGKVTWGLCDTTAGVISQIDNMVFWLVEPAAQAQVDAPDMFWDADDTENFAHEIQDIVDGYDPGEIVTIECAKRLPNFRVVVTRDGDWVSYDYLEAAHGIAAQQGDAA